MDESRKRPANTAMAVDLQVCKHDLQNTHLRAVDFGRVAQAQAITQANIAALQKALVELDAQTQARLSTRAQPNSIVNVRFDYGSTRVDIPPDIARKLIEEAKAAPLVVLRGRTDGQSETPAESQIARARSAAVSDYLVAAGVKPSQIRMTYQPTGDHAADNRTAIGRALNRRVEIEIYQAMPVALATSAPTTNSAH
ncbi:OmpA family protein [Paucibacter sp. PLA-PC-4]|uniref:OmpA family protein n=1 Tax=Paucibacter sp. PLA-PC-4 TaxID=2993655 RepID=UPI00224B94BA|nr:OmpA family protein [Paucibacter sp. PLA-PC-4]MCX2864946.1 OmpA family protein [Paucibacter sp. PLA-PC-4]